MRNFLERYRIELETIGPIHVGSGETLRKREWILEWTDQRAVSYTHLHRLKNGDFIQMEANTMEELAAFMSLSKAKPGDFVKGDMQVPAYRALYLDKVLEKNELFYARRDHARCV